MLIDLCRTCANGKVETYQYYYGETKTEVNCKYKVYEAMAHRGKGCMYHDKREVGA